MRTKQNKTICWAKSSAKPHSHQSPCIHCPLRPVCRLSCHLSSFSARSLGAPLLANILLLPLLFLTEKNVISCCQGQHQNKMKTTRNKNAKILCQLNIKKPKNCNIPSTVNKSTITLPTTKHISGKVRFNLFFVVLSS